MLFKLVLIMKLSMLFIVLGLSVFGMMGWLFEPALRLVGRVINVLFSTRA